MMTQIEMDVARSTIRKNKAVAEYYESQNAIHNCIDWEQRRYEIAKDVYTITCHEINPLRPEASAKAAVELADLLIAELKKESTK